MAYLYQWLYLLTTYIFSMYRVKCILDVGSYPSTLERELKYKIMWAISLAIVIIIIKLNFRLSGRPENEVMNEWDKAYSFLKQAK